ncbi:hypothetical protein ABH15_03630 [Methanoculleus taiwanensis]|uniref:Uncharacterized protein n=1 Tax=Methanoculleus taiwanensis TaxID=1550565 RepID=A0A498H6G1_9EURY|nr:hypothetical protein [Methanoculleus taiwanensis]RXE57214.1 hypothetical protein ABH15_03630 [Methanoculleus taiwanensis]
MNILQKWETRLGIALVAISVLIYMTKYLLFGDAMNTYQYIFNAMGFLPINILLVTLILNQLLSVRAKRDRLEKLNMVIGTFFSEVGTGLLAYLSDRDPNLEKIRSDLIVRGDWSDDTFARVHDRLLGYPYEITVGDLDLEAIRTYLMERRGFLLRLLENPVLLEHESFTELLRAAFHLTEELERRGDLTDLPESDIRHLTGDVQRVYTLLVRQWLAYMHHMQKNYPYLFSLAMRSNPFDETASPIVR